MKHRDDDRSIHRIAEGALDEDALGELLEIVGGEDCEAEAAAALRQVVADDIVWYALRTADAARRRARSLTAEDIGDVADGRGECCCAGPREAEPGVSTTIARYTKIDN